MLFTRHGVLAWNLDRSVGKAPVGEPECLSLHCTILPQAGKTENADPTQAPDKDSHSSRPLERDGLLLGMLKWRISREDIYR